MSTSAFAELDHSAEVSPDSRLFPSRIRFATGTVDARRTPKQILRAHLPDQRAQFCLDLRSPSPSTRFPTPIAAKAGTMPTYQRFRLDNRHDLQIDGNQR